MALASWDDTTAALVHEDPRLLRALDMVAPGTSLREGIDNVIHASTGALIVIGEPEEISFLFSGGLKLDVDYTPGLIYQVAKMDGAIVLDPEARKISWANVQLMPDPTIHSSETGTRHRTAERVSKQTERARDRDLRSPRRRLDLPRRHQVHPSGHPDRSQQGQPGPRDDGEIPAPARPRDGAADHRRDGGRGDAPRRPHRASAGRAPAADLQRGRALHHRARRRGPDDRDAARGDVGWRPLGSRLADPRLRGRPTARRCSTQTLAALSRLTHQELLDLGRLAELLGYDRKANPHDLHVSARGYRALGRIPRLPRLVGEKVIHHFGSLEEILAATDEQLAAIDGVGEDRAADIREGLDRVRESEVFERYPLT